MRVYKPDVEKEWMAVHIYYSEPWENFLTESLSPLIMSDEFQNSIDQFFFIRYWEKGPHIRLRLKADKDAFGKFLKPLLSGHINSYLRKYPSHRNDYNAHDMAGWYDNNSIQYLPYEPETVRYGGSSLLPIAEKQFQASSSVVLGILRDNYKDWDYSSILGAGIQLHLSFAYAAGMNESEAQLFFNQVFQNWFPRAYHVYDKNITKEELDKRKEYTLNAFKSNLAAQKNVLIPYVETIWHALKKNEDFEQDFLNDWVISNQQITKEMIGEVDSESFSYPNLFELYKTLKISEQNKRLWSVYDSFIHMTNNRLGIKNQDEGYLAYLMSESFKVIQ
ncbi:lantibiotic dehydratase C-terminal domain-containing protein [Fulvivirga ligni]|uniref:lantibiotic dehydratase C-terminal domain-containing protein n=1 Tax=Fulvivirga ligni TaxID=2904246 RepID=UPI001F22D3B5|nr:lantibiotic dehydratase C-terminal domain-containing protein [Fulvivirga ligni]UII21877.1 hypothetical protein LVD16_01340 [Fulvivirga ligni]